MLLSYLRTVFLYLVLIAVIRVLGKRQVGEMEPSEFVVTMLIANLASIPMQDGGIPLYSGLIPILTVLGVELVLSWGMLRSLMLRRLLCGKPTILIDNGRICQDALQRTRISLNELLAQLRSQQIMDVSTVQYAILETGGSLSVFPYPEEKPARAADAGIPVEIQQMPVTLVSDGCLLRENLPRAELDEAWVKEELNRRGTDIPSTFLLLKRGDGSLLWLEREERG